MLKPLLTIALVAALAPVAQAKIQTKDVEYKDGDTVLQGYLAYDDAAKGPRPGVLVAHAWTGLNDYTKRRARELAGLGYVAFASDIYGKGVRPTAPKDAGALATKYKTGEREVMRRRALLGLEQLKKAPNVDQARLGAIGYCFGGTTILELARSGAPLSGLVSFHGGLDTKRPQDSDKIKGKVLVLTGGDDPSVPPAQVEAFEDEMRKGHVDWELVSYGGAVHAFTDPDSGNDNSKGAAYNASADHRSFAAMQTFFHEVFGTKKG